MLAQLTATVLLSCTCSQPIELRTAIEDPRLGHIVSFVVLPDSRIGLLGHGGILWINDRLEPDEFNAIDRAESGGQIMPHDLDDDGFPEFLSHGGEFGSRTIRAFDTNGQPLWATTVKFHKQNLSAGKIWVLAPLTNNNNNARVAAIGRHNTNAVLLDGNGNKVGEEDWGTINSPGTAMIQDVDGNKGAEILYGTDGELVLRSTDGNVLWRSQLVPKRGYINYMTSISPAADGRCRWYVTVSEEIGFNKFRDHYFVITDRGSAAAVSRIEGSKDIKGQGRTKRVVLGGRTLDVGLKYDNEKRADYLELRDADGARVGVILLGADVQRLGYSTNMFVEQCVLAQDRLGKSRLLVVMGTRLLVADVDTK